NMTLSAYTFSLKNFYYCKEKYLQVQPELLVINVPDVKLKLLFPGKAVSSVYLSPAGYSRQHLVTPSLARCIEREVFHFQRPWSDETHLTFEYVKEFRKLVQTRTSQKRT